MTTTNLSTDEVTKNGSNDKNENVVEGPDLNASKSPFDKKEYRQILLPNGLRVVLISDTVAMTQSYNNGGIYMDDDEDDDSSSLEAAKNGGHKGDKVNDDDENDCDEDDDDEDSENGSTSGGAERGLRNAAAAMVVGVGSMSDPPECPGLAHFLEHLLFMGSEKYPQENAYDVFISKHGGSDNAYTEMEYTVYHFEIIQEYLAKALDMFAQFFTSPLMLESSVERELSSIESEFQLVKNSDSSRLQQLMCHTCGYSPAEHPFAKFSWGNLESLQESPKSNNVDPMVELRKFYDRHYYASNMRLVVIGGYPLDVLQSHVISSFSDVPSKGIKTSWDDIPESPFRRTGMPFHDHTLREVYYMAPVKDRHALSVTFQLPPQMENWKSKPCDYLAHLIGHESQGSLLSALKGRGWATGCCAGVGAEGYENASSHALFIVSLSLSEEGVANWREIVSLLYQYIGMIRYHCRAGLPVWIYEELRSIAEISYKFSDEPAPEDLVESLADELSPGYPLPADRLLDGSSLLFEYDNEKIQDIIDTYLKPENARIDLSSTLLGRSVDYEAVEPLVTGGSMPPSDTVFDPTTGEISPCQEPIFGTYYWHQALSDEQLLKWSQLSEPQLPPEESMLKLPPQNHFVPRNFSLRDLPPTDCDHPLLKCSIKLQVPVGRQKQWFPATVMQYNSLNNHILLSYEDEDEKWHKMDVQAADLSVSQLVSPEFEGTLDSKKIKYRVVAVAEAGEGAVRRFGDESDFDVDAGMTFPPIPPPPLPTHLPKLICNTSALKLWHLQDRTFKRPIAEFRLFMHCAEAAKTPLHSACADLFVHLISDALTAVAYLASVCELGSSMGSSDGGFSMRVHGFDDKLLDLFTVMFDLVMKFRGRVDGTLPDEIKVGRFELCLESYIRQCSNSGMKASKLANDVRLRCIRPNSWSSRQKLKAIENIAVPTFVTTVASILSKIGIEAILHGNVDAADAKRVQTEITKRLVGEGAGLTRKKYPPQLVTKIPPSSHTLKCPAKDPTDLNSVVELYFQVGKDNTRDRVMVDLLMEMMYEPLYDQVRTKDQFGYDVSCDGRWTNGVIGIHFKVVTSSKTTQEAQDRLELFIADFRQTLLDMKPSDFLHHLVAIANQKLDMFNSLGEETNHYWSEIRDGRYLWDVEREEVLCLKSFTKQDALIAYDEWLAPSSKTRRMLSIHVICSDGDAASGRPNVGDDEDVGDYNDALVKDYISKFCKNQTFGRVY